MVILNILPGCSKDEYKFDGGVSDPHVNMTTYDYLKSNPQFSSLVTLIDNAGLKDKINGNVTFFATTNYGVNDWVLAKKEERVLELNDENIKFTIDSIPVGDYKDSLLTYMFEGTINRDNMTSKGQLYNSLIGTIPNVQFLIRLRRSTTDYSDYLDRVDYVNFTKVIGSRDDLLDDPSAVPESEKDISEDCQTSGIITTTGIVHVLNGYHRLFFNTEKMADN
jgi:hypothetical protein